VHVDHSPGDDGHQLAGGRAASPENDRESGFLLPKNSTLSLILGGAAVPAAVTGLFSVPAPAAEAHGPAVQIRAPRPIPDSRYFPAPAGFRTAVFRSSAAIMR